VQKVIRSSPFILIMPPLICLSGLAYFSSSQPPRASNKDLFL